MFKETRLLIAWYDLYQGKLSVTLYIVADAFWDVAIVMQRLQLMFSVLGRVRLGSIRNKNNWNNASNPSFGSYSHSGKRGFHSGYSAPRSRIAGIYSGIHSYSGIFPNERTLNESSWRLASQNHLEQIGEITNVA